MIIIDLNLANYEYDVHSIVGAFYPGEQIRVQTPESKPLKNTDGQVVRICVRLREDGAILKLGEKEYCWEWRESAKGRQDDAWTDGEVRGIRQLSVQARSLGSLLNEQCLLTEMNDGKYKDSFKRFLYCALKKETGRELPWGNLTGIRPTKIAYSLLEQGKSDEEIVEYYSRKHYVSREKAELSIAIAKRERELLAGLECGCGGAHERGQGDEQSHDSGHNHGKEVGPGQSYSLYIGIPFCPTTCLYCSFTSFPIGGYRKKVDAYIDCIVREMEHVSGQFREKNLDCVYIGGGTPTTLEADQLERLLSTLRRLFDFSAVKEFTVEAGRADSITEEKLQVLYRHGVDRISINPQTMRQKTLDVIGRRASVEQVEEAYELARRVGFRNINMDLILGLPGELEEDVRYTVDRVVQMAPDSLTVHSLAIKRASLLNKWVQENGISMLRNTDETMRIAAEGAARLNLVPYYLYRQKNMSGNFENVGYAKEGKLGLYNILIMEEKQTIVALGAGSISKRVYPDGRIERCENVKDVALYIEKIDEMIERKRRLLTDF